MALSPAVHAIGFIALTSHPPVCSVGQLDQARASWAMQVIAADEADHFAGDRSREPRPPVCRRG